MIDGASRRANSHEGNQIASLQGFNRLRNRLGAKQFSAAQNDVIQRGKLELARLQDVAVVGSGADVLCRKTARI